MVPSATRWLLDHGADRVAYVDLDANHTDGVERVFWDDPRVLTISLHESGLHLFPHTGFPREVGGADARGTAVNVAFLPRTADRVWLHSFAAIVPPLIEAFRPQVIVAQHGADPHRSDPSPPCRCPWTPWPWPNASSSTSPTGSPAAAGSAWAAATTGMTQRACRRGAEPREVS